MIGQTFSHYRIFEKLGEGGMGVVYKGIDTNLERTVALKFLPADGEPQRFLREAKAAAALDHPNVCTVHEFGESEGRAFLAMAYVDGGQLAERIRDRPLKTEDALDIVIQTAEGLRAAHGKGIVHRDINCSNIMLTADGKVKITDFGLAHLIDRTRITQAHASVGTPAYMSPEQAQGLPVDRRTDIWSLGVGQRFLFAEPVLIGGKVAAPSIHLVENWFAESVSRLGGGLLKART